MAKLCAAGVTLRDQANKRWPSRDKASDGWIGDAAHAARDGWGTNGKGSYHNPDPRGVVHAIDLDEDFLGKGKGQKVAMEFAQQLATYCREGKDGGRIAHIVYEGQVASATANNWHFRGSGYGHFQHIHISFTNRADNDGRKFDLPIFEENKPKPPAPPKPSKIPAYPGRSALSYKQRNKDVKKMQEQLIKEGFAIANGPTGFYGDQTVSAVKKFYLSLGKKKDGKTMDPAAWNSLWGGK
jgi:hypothetical protein